MQIIRRSSVGFASLLVLLAAPVASAQEPAAPLDDEPTPAPAPPPPLSSAVAIDRLGLYQEFSIAFSKPPTGTNIDTSDPVIGANRRTIRGAAFYATLGRDDLARAYTRANRRRKVLMIVGGICAAAGLIVAETISFLPWGTNPSDAALALRLGGEIAASGVSVFGDIAFLVGRFSNPAPVNAATAAGLADEYNRHLRERLGLPDDAVPPTTSRSDGGHWSLLPQVRPTGGALVLARTF